MVLSPVERYPHLFLLTYLRVEFWADRLSFLLNKIKGAGGNSLRKPKKVHFFSEASASINLDSFSICPAHAHAHGLPCFTSMGRLMISRGHFMPTVSYDLRIRAKNVHLHYNR